jgi:hypothetical protein
MALADDLERIAGLAASYGPVTGVLAAEPTGGARSYLVALGDDVERSWLVVGDAAEPADDRELVREVASIVVMCELAGDLAGGGDLERLRSELARLRLTEAPPGIEAAEEASLALERAIGGPPRLASPAYLDAIGEATRRLESALGERGSPFAAAISSASPAVEAFVLEVEQRYARPLR